MASFNATVDRYNAVLANADAGGSELPNENFDAGGATIGGKYKGADEAYAKLLGKLADRQFAGSLEKLLASKSSSAFEMYWLRYDSLLRALYGRAHS
jgi:hypothetical protein